MVPTGRSFPHVRRVCPCGPTAVCWKHNLVSGFSLQWQKLFATVRLRQMLLGNVQISQVSRELQMNRPPCWTNAMFQIHCGNPEGTARLQRKCTGGAMGGLCPVACALVKACQYSWWCKAFQISFKLCLRKLCYSKLNQCPLNWKKKLSPKAITQEGTLLFYLALPTGFPVLIYQVPY